MTNAGPLTASLLDGLNKTSAANQTGDMQAKLGRLIEENALGAVVSREDPDYRRLLALSADYVRGLQSAGQEVPKGTTQWRLGILALAEKANVPKARWQLLAKYGRQLLPSQAAMKRARGTPQHIDLTARVIAVYALANPFDIKGLDMDTKDIVDVTLRKKYFEDDTDMAGLHAVLAKLSKLTKDGVSIYSDEVRAAENEIMEEANALRAAAAGGKETLGTSGYGRWASPALKSETNGKTPSLVEVRKGS